MWPKSGAGLRTSVIAAVASVAAIGCLLADPASLDQTVSRPWVPGLGLSISWRLEIAPLGLAALIAGIGALVLSYALVYFRRRDGHFSHKAGPAVALMSCFLSAMLGLVLAGDLLVLFVFWELTGVFSFFLIGIDRKHPESWPASRQALLVTVGGGLPLLAGALWLQHILGTTSLAALGAGALTPTQSSWLLALAIPAVLTKSAQLPFSAWLPRAMAAPTPVSALLHSATMVKAGIILLLYLAPALSGSVLWSTVLVPAGGATCLWGAYRALTVLDLKRLLAYSTVSQLGLLVVTLGLGTDVAVRAATLHLFAHAIFKAGLFLAVGSIERATGTRRLDELGGLWRREPVLCVAVAILAGSMAGLPPLAGFLSKELILKKAMLGQAWMHGVAISTIVLGAIGTVAYSARLFAGTFLGTPRRPVQVPPRQSASDLVAPVLLAALTLAAGLGAPWVDRWFLEPVAQSLVGAPLPVKPLSLWYGLEAAFVLSMVIVAAGWLSHRRLGLRTLPARSLFGDRWSFDGFLASVTSLGRRVEREIAGRSSSLYQGILMAAATAVLWVAVAHGGGLQWTVPDAEGLGLLALMALGIGALLASRQRITAVLALSSVGLVVALFFRRLAAPDLMLTQVAVEILTTVLFAAALIRLPRRERAAAPRLSSAARALVAVAGGLGLALLSLGLAGVRPADALPDYFLAQAPAGAGGGNVVNVILTDFRGLDTLIETLVIALAAFGAAALAGGEIRRSTPAPGAGSGSWGMLPLASPLVVWTGTILAFALLVKGHDQPGGGFVAGLVLAVIAILGHLANPGEAAVETLSRGLRWGVCGLAIALLWPALAGLAPLTHLHGKITAIGLKWNTVLLFEVAITTAVACGVALAAIRLWRRNAP
jgi:multicomponent K+:H+ antiporter subunit A